jgi:hypothetical protein
MLREAKRRTDCQSGSSTRVAQCAPGCPTWVGSANATPPTRQLEGRSTPFINPPDQVNGRGGPADDPSGLKNSTRLVRTAATAIRPSAVNPITKISAGTIHEPTGFEAAIAVIPLDSGWRDRCRKCPARRPNDAGGFEKRRQFHVSQPGSGGRQQGSTKKTQGAKPKALSPSRQAQAAKPKPPSPISAPHNA